MTSYWAVPYSLVFGYGVKFEAGRRRKMASIVTVYMRESQDYDKLPEDLFPINTS